MSNDSLDISGTNRRFLIAALLITLLALVLRVAGLASQPVSHDDFDVAVSAINYMESGQLGPTMWNHPVLRNILVYYAMKLFGTGVIGVKGVSLLFGVLTTLLIAVVGRRMFPDYRIALLAALLWAVDPLAIDFSRQAINDIYLAFFPLAAIYCVYRFRDAGGAAWLIGAGVLFGCGLASKWSVVFPLAVTFGLVIKTLWDETKDRTAERLARTLHAASFLIVLPALLYFLTFLPWFGRGYSLSEWPALQKSMFIETSQHTGYKPGAMVGRDIKAYEWFIRPVTFVDTMFNIDRDDQVTISTERNATVLLAMSNPLVWLLVLPAVFFLTMRGWKERNEGLLFLSALFLFSYVPLVAARRPIWLNTALSVLPFALMVAAWLVWTLADRFGNRNRIIAVYLAFVIAVSAPLYFLATGKGLQMPFAKEYLMKRYLSETTGSPRHSSGDGRQE